MVDLANHSFAPNATYGVSPDGAHFQLAWDASGDERKPGGATPLAPAADDEVLICYGERMPNALLMLHYGFLDPDNPNDPLPMEIMIPGARKIRMGSVSRAGKALEDGGDKRAAWAAMNMMSLADAKEEGDDASAGENVLRGKKVRHLHVFTTTITPALTRLFYSSPPINSTYSPLLSLNLSENICTCTHSPHIQVINPPQLSSVFVFV